MNGSLPITVSIRTGQKKQKVSVRVNLPEAYVIPAEWTTIIDRLRIHGIRYDKLENEFEKWKSSNPDELYC